jgi:hypothetical protein
MDAPRPAWPQMDPAQKPFPRSRLVPQARPTSITIHHNSIVTGKSHTCLPLRAGRSGTLSRPYALSIAFALDRACWRRGANRGAWRRELTASPRRRHAQRRVATEPRALKQSGTQLRLSKTELQLLIGRPIGRTVWSLAGVCTSRAAIGGAWAAVRRRVARSAIRSLTAGASARAGGGRTFEALHAHCIPLHVLRLCAISLCHWYRWRVCRKRRNGERDGSAQYEKRKWNLHGFLQNRLLSKQTARSRTLHSKEHAGQRLCFFA